MTLDEAQQVILAAAALDRAGRPWALATIVAVAGSTYRRPGARLLVRDDGTWVGNLSGGCLEGEVVALAVRAMQDGVLRRESFDLTADDEAIWGWGLGCNGAMEVVVEAGVAARAHVAAVSRARGLGADCRLVHVIGPIDPPHRLLGTHAALQPGGSGGPADLPASVVEAAAGRSRATVVRVGDLEVFVEPASPPQRLIVCGAGDDAIPLVARAASLGWEVTVADDRSSLLDEARFPGASALVRCRADDVAAATGADGHTAAVVMSHNFLRDAGSLSSLGPAGLAYVGMLGPAQRLARLLGHLADQGVETQAWDRDVLHGPAGLDVGAEGPDEVALAIVAEVLAVVRGRGGGPLRARPGPIHDPTPGVASSRDDGSQATASNAPAAGAS